MTLKNITEEEYKNFALNNEFISIYQLPEWGKLKASNGWIPHFMGMVENDTIIGATLMLQKKLPLGFSLFYAPRGLLFDLNNYELLRDFTKKIKKYLKKYKALLLKVDPNVIYRIYDKDKENPEFINKEALDNLIKLNYKHYGFTQNFETMQPRFLCRIDVLDTYEKTFDTFSKSTRKNILKTEAMGIKTREIGTNEIDEFVSLLEETGKKKGFVIRPASYYKLMYNLMSEYMKLYISYLDTTTYYNYIKSEIDICKENILKNDALMKSSNVGHKLKQKKEQLDKHLEKLNIDLKEAEVLKEKSPTINIGALMSIFMKDEGITFMSGTNSNYKKFNPKYAYYSKHIKDTVKLGKKYCNFYGISGNMDKNGPYYSMYEIKKGFNPSIIELIGEFDLITNPLGHLYKLALKVYKLFK